MVVLHAFRDSERDAGGGGWAKMAISASRNYLTAPNKDHKTTEAQKSLKFNFVKQC